MDEEPSEFSNLLKRQLKRYLKEMPISTELEDLLNAINRSYQHYERDHSLGKHSLEVSSLELHQLADELAEKEKFMRAILEAASDGILVLDESKKIEICNPLARQMLKLDTEEDKEGFLYISLPQKRGLYELALERQDFSIQPVELSVSEIFLKQKRLFIYVLRDISARKETEKEMISALEREHQLQKQIVSAARQAGMMEVATSVLHNVGNVLTTINVSTTLIREMILFSNMHHFPKVADLLKRHKEDLALYLFHDPQGKHLPDFIIALSEKWQKENDLCLQELNLLEKSVQHIKNIIKVQQSMSGVLGIKESVSVNLLLNDLIMIHAKEFHNHRIEVFQEYEDVPEIMVDRVRLLQILVNLFRNAIEAMDETKTSQKNLTLCTRLKDPKTLVIEVSDNGCGIDQENLVKIFSFGFTTKEEGHGFGLHACAILAGELGGKLEAKSEGLDKGATFSLTLPCTTENNPKRVEPV